MESSERFFGQEQWSNACRHADSMVEKAMKNDHIVEISLDKLIINLADESSDSAASHSNSDCFFCKLLVLIISFFFVFVFGVNFFSCII